MSIGTTLEHLTNLLQFWGFLPVGEWVQPVGKTIRTYWRLLNRLGVRCSTGWEYLEVATGWEMNAQPVGQCFYATGLKRGWCYRLGSTPNQLGKSFAATDKEKASFYRLGSNPTGWRTKNADFVSEPMELKTEFWTKSRVDLHHKSTLTHHIKVIKHKIPYLK